jgi:23S rRNA pseudouridine1911/1915/1917 synthase
MTSTRRHSSPDEWRERLHRGEVELDGVTVDAAAVLRAGQTLVWHRPPWDEPDVPLHFDLVHEDAALVAVCKPSGLPTLPAGGFVAHTLLTLVRGRYPDAIPMHRLGRHTSGLVLFARSPPVAASLARAWRAHDVRKHYAALGAGAPTWDRLEITAPIGPVPHPRLGSVYAARPDGKPSRSIAVVAERRPDSTLFGVEITTGRPHQIRIHLACAGHPLVGDPLYTVGGVPCDNSSALPGDGGYLLHAERLAFVHPRTNAPIELVAPPPVALRCRNGSALEAAGLDLADQPARE